MLKAQGDFRRASPARLDSDVRQILTDAGAAPDSPPDEAGWAVLVELIAEQQRELSQLRAGLDDARRARSAFESLFRTSPVPMMEQDYSEMLAWMAELRSAGVADVREHLGEDIPAIRGVVPMIRVAAANPAAVEAVGIPHDHLIGPIDPSIVNEGSQQGWLTQIGAVWDRKPYATASFTAATASGEPYFAQSILSAPLIDGEPDFTRAVLTLIDITRHREEERRMAQLVEAKDRFLASVSHEIRTPLTAILGFARLLERGEGLTEDDATLMNQSIVEQAQDLSNLVDDLLVAARADIGQLDILDVEFDVMDQVAKTLDAGGAYSHDVRVVTKAEVPRAKGDPSRVRQILRNLLTNADRYGGPTVEVRISVADQHVVVDVWDDGAGLSQSDHERIFQPYESAHGPGSKTAAVGIGLTISRQLAEKMGGTLRYLDEGGNSTFRLCLPRAG